MTDRETVRQSGDMCLQASDRDRERRTRTEKDGEKTETKYCIDWIDRQTGKDR